MLPPTLSQSARVHLAANGSAIYRTLFSPHTVRVVAASAVVKLSPTLRSNSRSCWGWSRLDRANARANHAYMRAAHRIAKARMIKAASDRSWLDRIGTRSPFGWRLSSSWGPREVHGERDSNKDTTDRYKSDVRNEEEPFELSEREKRWRKREEELRRWVTENPYEAIFGYSNRLGRFGQRGGLFDAFRARGPSEAMREVIRDTDPDAELTMKASNTLPGAAKELNSQSRSSDASAAPAKATKMGHGSSTPRNATVLTEAPLVYDPISNRMVPKTGEFSHYGQELDVGSKLPVKSYTSAPVTERTLPKTNIDASSEKARAESLANSIARADAGDTVVESRQSGTEESWWLQREGFLDSIPQTSQSTLQRRPAVIKETNQPTTPSFNHEHPIIEEITSSTELNDGQNRSSATAAPSEVARDEYTKYKERRLQSLDESDSRGQERPDQQRLASIRSEKRQQIARRAKLERDFEKVPATEKDLPEVLTWKNARDRTATMQEQPTEEDILALAALGSLGVGQGLETALDRHIMRKAAGASAGLQTSLERHSKSSLKENQSARQTHDMTGSPLRAHEPYGYDHARESRKQSPISEPEAMPYQEFKEILQTRLAEGLASQTSSSLDGNPIEETPVKLKRSTKPTPRIPEDEEPDFASLDGSLSVELDKNHTSLTTEPDEILESLTAELGEIRTSGTTASDETPSIGNRAGGLRFDQSPDVKPAPGTSIYFILSLDKNEVDWSTTDSSQEACQVARDLAAKLKRLGNVDRLLFHLQRKAHTHDLEVHKREGNLLVLRITGREEAVPAVEEESSSSQPFRLTKFPSVNPLAQKDADDEAIITKGVTPPAPETNAVFKTAMSDPLIRRMNSSRKAGDPRERRSIEEPKKTKKVKIEELQKAEELKTTEELKRAEELRMLQNHDTLEDLVRVEDLKPSPVPLKAPEVASKTQPSPPPPAPPSASENLSTSRNPVWAKYRRRAREETRGQVEAATSPFQPTRKADLAGSHPPTSTIPEFRRSNLNINDDISPILTKPTTGNDPLSSPPLYSSSRVSRRTRRFWIFMKRFATMFGFGAAVLYVAGLIMQYRGEKQRSGAFGAAGRRVVFDEEDVRKRREG